MKIFVIIRSDQLALIRVGYGIVTPQKVVKTTLKKGLNKTAT